MTSGSFDSAISRPAFPSEACTTVYPSPANRSAINDLIQGSSSTTRIVLHGLTVVLMLGSPLLRRREATQRLWPRATSRLCRIRVAALAHLHGACHIRCGRRCGTGFHPV